MNVTLQGIPVGKWRNLTDIEMQFINESVQNSVKTEEGSYEDYDEE